MQENSKIIVPDTVKPDIFIKLVDVLVKNESNIISKTELKEKIFDYLENIEEYNLKKQQEKLINNGEYNETKYQFLVEKIIKTKNKLFGRALTYIKKLGIVENNKKQNIELTSYFLNKKNKFKNNSDFIIKEILEDNYKDLLSDNYISKKQIFEKLKDNYSGVKITKNSISKYTNMLFYLLNYVLKQDFELSKLNDIVKLSNFDDKKKEIINIIIEKLVMISKEDLDNITIKSIKKILEETTLLDQYIKEEFNSNLSNFLAILTDRPELAMFPDFYKNIPNAKKSKEILEEVINTGKTIINKKEQNIKFIYFSSDTDNDGTSGKAIVDILKKIDSKTQIINEYNKPSAEVKHGISYEEILNYFQKNNLDKKTPFVLVTIDNGANNIEEVKKIKKDFPNVKVIITDHHNPSYNLEDIKNEDIIVVNHHFLKDRKVLQGYEPSGGETFAVIAKNIINDNEIINKSEKKVLLTWIENISQFSTIADMVKSFNHLFLNPKLREKYGKIINKLNAILTLEKIFQSVYTKDKNLISNQIYGLRYEELNETQKENIDIYYRNVEKIEKYGYIINKLIDTPNINDIKNIEEYFLFLYSELEKEDIQKIHYTNLFEFRNKYLKLITSPSLGKNEEFILDLIDNKFKLLDLTKELEKSFIYQLDTSKNTVIENEYSTIVFTPGKNRKLTNKLDPKYYNGILIMLDNLTDNEINGSIRIKGGILFEELLRQNLENKNLEENLKIKKYFEKLGTNLGLNIEIRGHKTGAAGFIIKNYNNGLKKLGWYGKEENKLEYIKLLLNKLNHELNNSYENLLSKKNENIININLRTLNNMDILTDIMSILKMSNITHGNKLKVNFNVPLEEIKIINKENTSHIKVFSKNKEKQLKIIEYIKSYPKNYLGTVLNFEGQNLIINKQTLLEALYNKLKNPKKNIDLTFNTISPTSNISMEYQEIKGRSKVFDIKTKKNEIVNDYPKYFNEDNNYTIKINSIEEFVNQSPIIYKEQDKKLVVKSIKDILEKNKADEYVVIDVEGMGFGKNNLLFNIQVHRFTKNNKVYTHSFFINPEEILDGIALPPSIIKLTGINEESIKKYSLPIKFVSNFFHNIFKNKKILALAHNNQYDKNAMLTTLQGKIIDDINKWTWIDTAQIARENELAIKNENPDRKASIISLDNNDYKLNIGNYVNEKNYPLSLKKFISEPFDNKQIVSENEKQILLIKKEKDGYKLYLKDLQNSSQTIYLESLDNIYIYEEIPDKNGKIKALFSNYEGKEVHPNLIIQNKGKVIDFSSPLKSRKYSIQEMANKLLIDNYLEYLENKNMRIDPSKFNLKTGILDIDNFYETITKYTEVLIDKNIKDKNEFISVNKKYIKENLKINFIDLVEYINNKFKLKIDITGKKEVIKINSEDFLMLDISLNNDKLKEEYIKELYNNNKLNKTETVNYEKNNLEKVITSVFKKKKTEIDFQIFIKNYVKKLPQLKIFKNEIFNKLKKENIYKENIYNQITEIIVENLLDKNLNSSNKNNLENKLIDVSINEYLNELYELVNVNNYITHKILKKVVGLYNSNIDIRENKENFYNKVANFVPDSVMEYLISNIDVMFKELLENNPNLKNYCLENNIKDIKELFVELHNNVHPINSDTGIESLLVPESMIRNKNVVLKVPEEFEKSILKEKFKNMKNENKKTIPNSFSFNQLIEILENDETVDNNNLQSQINYLQKELKNGILPVKITSSSSLLVAKIKLNEKLRKFLNIKDIKNLNKYKDIIKEIESYLNYMFNLKRIYNTILDGKLKGIDSELSLIFENKFKKMEKEFIDKFGDYYLVEDYTDNLINSLKKTAVFNNNIKNVNTKFITNQIVDLVEDSKKMNFKDLKTEINEIKKGLPSLNTIINNDSISFEEKEKQLTDFIKIINMLNEIFVKKQLNSKEKIWEKISSKASIKDSLSLLINTEKMEILNNIQKLKTENLIEKKSVSYGSNETPELN